MKSAAPKTYISKRMMVQYSEQRAERANAKKKAQLAPAKQFQEDAGMNQEEEKKEEQPQMQQAVSMAAGAQAQPVTM